MFVVGSRTRIESFLIPNYNARKIQAITDLGTIFSGKRLSICCDFVKNTEVLAGDRPNDVRINPTVVVSDASSFLVR